MKILEELFTKDIYTPGHWQGHRKLLKGKRSKRITMFASRKNGFSMPCESSLEKQYCYHLEFDEAIKSYRTQGIQFEIDGFKYTPDFILLTHLNTFKVVEIKPQGSLKDKELAFRLSRVKAHFEQRKIAFEIVTDEFTNRQPVISNYMYLYRAAKLPFTKNETERAFELISNLDSRSFKKIRKMLIGNQLPVLIAEQLVIQGKLKLDLTKPISSETEVFLKCTT